MPRYISLGERYDSFGDSGTPPSRHASQASVHEVGPSCVANDPAPSPPQTLPSYHALGPQHTPISGYVSPYPAPVLTPPTDPASAHGLALNQQPLFSPDSQVQGSQGNSVSYTGLPSPPSSTGHPSPKQRPAKQTDSFGCDGCDKTYTHKSALARHHLESKKCRLGQGGRSFTCFLCARSVAARRSTLKQHLMEVHAMEKQEAEDLLDVWYQRYGEENVHSGVAALLGLE